MDWSENDFDFCKNYMVNGEYILWKGKPEKGIQFTAADLFLTFFGLAFGTMPLVWVVAAFRAGAPIASLVCVPFVAIGFYMALGRFIANARKRKKTFYVVTNKKIMRKVGSKIDMMDIKHLPSVTVIAHKNGNGTIEFGQVVRFYSGDGKSETIGSSSIFRIENIANAVRIQELISNAQ